MAKLGQQVDVYCGQCKVERYHTVAALGDGGRIERVVCGYCQSARRYKNPALATRARTTASPRRSRAKAEPADTGSPGRAYAAGDRFEKGEYVVHARYGRGRVTEVRGDRIDVRFPDGETRTFLHAGG